MKVFTHLAGLSAAATLILQLGTFVEASPFFAETSNSIHGNVATSTQQCQGLRFSFPSATDLSFEEKSKHVVAWQAPATLNKVALTLVKNDDPTNSSINIGNFDANAGATNELPLDLHGQQLGEYHYHIQATGSAGDCNIDSVTFTIAQQNQQQGGQHDNNANNHADAQLDDLISNLKHTQNVHANDETFDILIQNIHSQSPSANDHTDAQFDDLISKLKYTQNAHANSDQTFDNLVHTIQSQPPSANDHTDTRLDDLVNDLKHTETRHSNDQALYGLVNDLKTSSSSAASQHANDLELDNLISNLPATGDIETDLVKDIKSATTTNQPAGHQDATLNSELDTLAGRSTMYNSKLDTLIADISKSTTSSHQKDHGDADPAKWDAMINDIISHANQQESTHPDAANPFDPKSFKSFIDGLDQDYTKYIDKNKDSETKQVNHKNDAKIEDASTYANEWVTGSDLRAKINNMKRAFRRSLLKRGSDYSTNGDQHPSSSATHGNGASSVSEMDSRPVWSTNGGDDQGTNVDFDTVHNDAEWAEDDGMASRPVWSTNDGSLTNDDDQHSSVQNNDAEWAEDHADGVWQMDEIVDVPEWTMDDDIVTAPNHHQNSVWETVELAEEPAYAAAPNHHHNNTEWNVSPTTQEQQAPSHHRNDIEWNVHDSGGDEFVTDHTSFVHWDAEFDNVEDESDENGHVNAATEGEWVDDDDNHTNAATDDDHLEWALDSVEVMEDADDDESAFHDNSDAWQTDEQPHDDDLSDNSNRWSLNEDVTEWSSNAFDEKDDDLLSNVPSHANDNNDAEWRASEHANDDDSTEEMTGSVNDGPSEWRVDDEGDNNDGVDQPHGNDATLTSQWLMDEHTNDTDAPANEWNVNEASTGWSINEASVGGTTTTGQYVNDNEWNVNEATGDWNTDPFDKTTSTKPTFSPHPNAASEWLTSESVHSNDVTW